MEDERIETRWFTARELDKLIESGKIMDAKTQIGFLKWKRYRRKVNIASSAWARWLTSILSVDVRFAEGAAEGLVVEQRIVSEAVASRAAHPVMRPSTSPRKVCTSLPSLTSAMTQTNRAGDRCACQSLQQECIVSAVGRSGPA